MDGNFGGGRVRGGEMKSLNFNNFLINKFRLNRAPMKVKDLEAASAATDALFAKNFDEFRCKAKRFSDNDSPNPEAIMKVRLSSQLQWQRIFLQVDIWDAKSLIRK